MIDLNEYSIRLELLEYNHIEGMITQSEYTKSIRKGKHGKGLKKVKKLDTIEIYTVLRTDRDGGYIDLSKIEITPEETAHVQNKFAKGKSVQSLMFAVCEKLLLNEKLTVAMEVLYKSIVFPLQRSGEHAYDSFHNNIFNLEKIVAPLKLQSVIQKTLIETVSSKYTPAPEKIKAVFEMRTLSKDGVLDLQRILREVEKFSSQDVKLTVLLEATPYYTIYTVTSNRPKAVLLIEECLKFAQSEIIKLEGGKYELKSFNKVSNENENEYAELMKLQAVEDKRSIMEEDNDEGMGTADEINFD